LSSPGKGPARLTIDLRAIAANYQRLRRLAGGVGMAAVVKADAYGLGMEGVAPALARAGCRDFFVARLGEGAALRALVPPARIFILDGFVHGEDEADLDAFREHQLVPVLNDDLQLQAYAGQARRLGQRLAVALHLDTGMARLGFGEAATRWLAAAEEVLANLHLELVMSHLACAEEPQHPLNALQLQRFTSLAELFQAPRSFANSSGIFLGPAWRFDLCRPGAALYGVNPTPGRSNPMLPVVRLEAPVLQRRDVDAIGTVGYGATTAVFPGSRLLTLPLGYADGFPRSTGPGWRARLLTHELPLAGRVSMDLLSLDATALPAEVHCGPGTMIELIGGPDGVDRLAAAAGTIGYEILTRLGRRYERIYLDDETASG
jgi:alanine racemase